MKIEYYGQSCFFMETDAGTRIVTDPFGKGVGYVVPSLAADVVTVSHFHFDHNNTDCIEGTPAVYTAPGRYETADVKITGLPSFHDDVHGAKRGKNTIFCFEADGLRLCHLGDLGHLPSAETVRAVGRPDVLFVPVGEVYTFSVRSALKTAELLRARVVVPMHYGADGSHLGLAPVDKFLREAQSAGTTDTVYKTVDRLTIATASPGKTEGITVITIKR